MQNERTVFVVQNDPRKDYSAANEYGKLKDIFGDVRGRYKTDAMLEHARRVLANWQPGDHILIGGDPTLCGIAIAVALEQDSVVRTLNWDKYDFQYISRRWDFGPEARGVQPGPSGS